MNFDVIRNIYILRGISIIVNVDSKASVSFVQEMFQKRIAMKFQFNRFENMYVKESVFFVVLMLPRFLGDIYHGLFFPVLNLPFFLLQSCTKRVKKKHF